MSTATIKLAIQQAWSTTVPGQIKTVAAVLSASPVPPPIWMPSLPTILDTLVAIGRVQSLNEKWRGV